MAYKVIDGRLVKVKRGITYVPLPDPFYPPPKNPKPDPKLKGVKGGNCNRTHCQLPGANWYNHGSLAYYCESCAWDLNHDAFNYRDAMENWGHLLCTLAE
jgi:hypothetical protein